MVVTSLTSARGEYEVFAYDCGRQQVNIAPCRQPRSGSLSWLSDWVSATHFHVNSSAAYYLVFYTGSDSHPAIVWERRL